MKIRKMGITRQMCLILSGGRTIFGDAGKIQSLINNYQSNMTDITNLVNDMTGHTSEI